MFNDPVLVAQIKHDEGRSPVVYKDSKGLWTIGDGILVDFRIHGAGLRNEEMDFITNNRVAIAAQQTMALVGPQVWARIGPPRRRALTNMCYNLGLDHLDDFKKALKAVADADYVRAAAELKDSLWYGQVGNRAKRICKVIETGVEQDDPLPQV